MIVATADSNVYISALQFGGVPRQFLTYARSHVFTLAVSEPLIAEIEGVLLKKFQWSADMIDEGMNALKEFTLLVHPRTALAEIIDDPDDNRVLECAVESHSQFIVSGDKHLLRLVTYQGIRIVKVADFLTFIPIPAS